MPIWLKKLTNGQENSHRTKLINHIYRVTEDQSARINKHLSTRTEAVSEVFSSSHLDISAKKYNFDEENMMKIRQIKGFKTVCLMWSLTPVIAEPQQRKVAVTGEKKNDNLQNLNWTKLNYHLNFPT